MQVMKTILDSKHFRDRCKAYLNGKYFGEHHVYHCAVALGKDLADTFGNVSLLGDGYSVIMAFREEDSCIYITRGVLPDADDARLAEAYSTAGGWIGLYEGRTGFVNECLARLSEAAKAEQSQENTSLFH